MPDNAVSNTLLRCLGNELRDQIMRSTERVPLALKQKLEEAGEPIRYVHFVETGIVSRIVRAGSEQIEIGITGREGLLGASLAQGWPLSTHEHLVQIAGEAWRIPADAFKEHLAASSEFRDVVLRFNLVQSHQTSHTCLANGRFSILERAARWILMCHDRVDQDDFQLTHEFMALMLGVRRAGVTSEMHTLEGERAIRNRRGVVTVRDRARLEEIAGDAYGLPETLYAEMIGTDFRPRPSPSEGVGG